MGECVSGFLEGRNGVTRCAPQMVDDVGLKAKDESAWPCDVEMPSTSRMRRLAGLHKALGLLGESGRLCFLVSALGAMNCSTGSSCRGVRWADRDAMRRVGKGVDRLLSHSEIK